MAKSVLDNVPVVEKGDVPQGSKVKSTGTALRIVGHCPTCGAPIYGTQDIYYVQGGPDPIVKHSCQCYQKKTISEAMQTK